MNQRLLKMFDILDIYYRLNKICAIAQRYRWFGKYTDNCNTHRFAHDTDVLINIELLSKKIEGTWS